MPQNRSPQALAKMLAYMLGRRPDEFGLVPDAEGFVKVKELLKALNEEPGFGYVNATHLNEVRLSVPDPPFEWVENRIRARVRPAGGEVPGEQALPKLLFVGIRRRAHRVVLERGIGPGAQERVVLCESAAMAARIARRSDPDPVMLTVQVAACRARGIAFERAGEGLYLSPAIPPGCFTGPALAKEKEAAEEQRTPAPKPSRRPTPGSFALEPADDEAALVPKSLRGRRRGKEEKPWKRERPPWRR
jgi:putative RNA 2'-phosphotransferase